MLKGQCKVVYFNLHFILSESNINSTSNDCYFSSETTPAEIGKTYIYIPTYINSVKFKNVCLQAKK